MWDWIVNILFELLKLIQTFAVDWGLSIIILVVIIRLLLTPLMLKSTKSTARMQVLQPKMLEIQERYADDPQRQAEEMQKFYSENKFNPMAGCLPLLIQMPVLFALFTLLRNLPDYFNDGTFSFFNILPDLTTTPSASFADGFMVALPALVCLILFAVLTLIPQLYMSRNQTGQQAQSMRMMAVVMTVMMLWMGWSLPVGVLLYYDVSSAWQVIQQIFVTQKVIDKAKADEEERLKNAPLQVEVTRREKKPRPHKKTKGNLREIKLYAQVGFTGTDNEFNSAYRRLKDNQIVEVGFKIPILTGENVVVR